MVDENGYDLGYHVVDAYRGDMADFEERMNFLIAKGYDPIMLQKDGSNLLHAAIKKMDIDLLKYLVDKGIDINAADSEGQTILHAAAMQAESSDILRYLLEAGANKAVRTAFDESAYDLAMQNEMLSQKNIDLEFLKI